jgi:KTSC domain-containing protein
MATLNPLEGSRNVAAYGYDEATGEFSVQFKQRDGSPAPRRYDYPGVPPEVHTQINEAESPGSAIQRLIVNGGYDFTKVDLEPEEGADS